jgi:hypothetical protein
MNYFAASYNPMNAFAQGYGLGDAMRETAAREHERQRAMAARQGLIDFGQRANLLGYEDNPAAVMPEYMKKLYATNPEVAVQLEQHVAAPFQLQREITKAGEFERAKRQADADVGITTMNAFAKTFGVQPQQGQSLPASTQPVSMTDGEAAPVGGGAMPPYNLSGLSDYEPHFEMTPQGFKFGVKRASPLDSAIKVSDAQVRQADQKLKERDFEEIKKEDLLVKKSLANKDLQKDIRDAAQQAHDRVRTLRSDMQEAQDKIESGEIRPSVGQARIQQIGSELKQAQSYRDSLLFGRDSLTPDTSDILSKNPEAKAGQGKRTQQPIQGVLDSTAQPAPLAPEEAGVSRGSIPLAKGPAIGAGLPYKKQVEAQQKKLEGDITQTRNILDASQAAAMAAQQSKPATDRIMELLTKNNIGSRFLKLPGGETAATMVSGNYDELNKWRNSLILQEKSEGESQLYNTLPELKIHSASLPSIDNDENTNRRAIVPVKNLMEARMVAPKFLQQWADQHGGAITGAREEFRSWMQHNPMYQTHETNGEVGIHENTHFIPLDIWTRLRQRFSEKDILKKRDSGGIQVLNGRVFFKE